jgi:two-component system sensor histidine kinase PilS (NtrC family)
VGVNGIIENILQLSRRGNTVPEPILLKAWLEQFVDEFVLSQRVAPDWIALNVTPPDIVVNFDKTQLHQIIWNLNHNALRFSIDYPQNPKVEITASYLENSHRPFLDIFDHGPGIDAATAQQIFEPFFTTDSKGSGLGLYIARELCELNKASIRHLSVPGGGTCFRIEFAPNPTVQ